MLHYKGDFWVSVFRNIEKEKLTVHGEKILPHQQILPLLNTIDWYSGSYSSGSSQLTFATTLAILQERVWSLMLHILFSPHLPHLSVSHDDHNDRYNSFVFILFWLIWKEFMATPYPSPCSNTYTPTSCLVIKTSSCKAGAGPLLLLLALNDPGLVSGSIFLPSGHQIYLNVEQWGGYTV